MRTTHWNRLRGLVRSKLLLASPPLRRETLRRHLFLERLEERRVLATLYPGTVLTNPENDGFNDIFGHSVAIENEYAVVGSPADDDRATNAGAVHLYRGADPTPIVLRNPETLNVADHPENPLDDQFGYDVAIASHKLFVGAPFDHVFVPAGAGLQYNFDAGSVRIFNVDNLGAGSIQVEHPDAWSAARFGISVAASSNVLLVSADITDGDIDNNGIQDPVPGTSDSGVVYALNPTTGAKIRHLVNPSPLWSDLFGRSVDVSGNWAIIGAPGDNGASALDVGAAYLWNWQTGAIVQTIVNPNPSANDQFGFGVAIFGDKFVVTAPYDDLDGTDAGVAYLYSFNTTTGTSQLLQTIHNPATGGVQSLDLFGYSVDMSAIQIAVGLGSPHGPTVAARSYVFLTSNGALEQSFVTPTGSNNSGLGRSVAVNSNQNSILFGAPFDSVGGHTGGAAYFYAARKEFTVNSVTDLPDAFPGDGVAQATGSVTTLRSAIHEANYLLGRPEVKINLPEGRYSLSQIGTELHDASLNDLDVIGNITLQGVGAGLSVIDAGGSAGLGDRVFEIRRGGTLTALSLTIANGYSGPLAGGGGGIYVDSGNVTLMDSAMIGNRSDSFGGAIVRGINGAVVAVERSLFKGNSAGTYGGALGDGGGVGEAAFGASVFIDNTAGSGGNTISTTSATSPVNLGNNLVNNAVGSVYAGGAPIFLASKGDLLETATGFMVVTGVADRVNAADNEFSLREGIIAANAASNSDKLWLPAWTFPLTIQGNEFLAQAGDLDIFNPLTIVGVGPGLSVINAAGLGDRVIEIYNGATVGISRLTVANGYASVGGGGGIYAGTGSLTLTDAALVNNGSADFGGGLVRGNVNANVTIDKTLFKSNTAVTYGGAIGEGGGTGQTTFGRSVFVDNTAGIAGHTISTNSPTSPVNLGSNLVNNAVGSNYSTGTAIFTTTKNDFIAAPGTSIVVVTSIVDRINPADNSFSLSLREAVLAANGTSADELIWLPPWLYMLSLRGDGENAAATGDLDVLDSLAIRGIAGSAGATKIDATLFPIDSVFQALGGALLTLNDITIAN